MAIINDGTMRRDWPKNPRRDYPVIVNIMTYKGDQEIIPYCVRSLLKIFEKNPLEIYVMDDSKNPMNGRNVRWLKNLAPNKIFYEQTSFERNKNLNGMPCVVGMMEKFIEHANGRDALNIKIDPDTIVCHREVFDEVYNHPNSGYASSTRPGCHFSGVLYMFKTEYITRALELLKTFPVPDHTGPEDYIIGLAFSAASLPKLSLMIDVWSDESRKGAACGWNYGIEKAKYPSMIPFYHKMFQFITMGNWFASPNLTSADRIPPSEALVKYIENRKEVF